MATERKNKQISTTLAPEKFQALEDYRWDNRVNKIGDVLTAAVEEFIVNHQLEVQPAEADTADAPKGK